MRSENHTNDRSQERTFIETVRRAQIVEHTIEVLAEHGHGKASLALIAQRAGIELKIAAKVDAVDEEYFETAKTALRPGATRRRSPVGPRPAPFRSSARCSAW